MVWCVFSGRTVLKKNLCKVLGMSVFYFLGQDDKEFSESHSVFRLMRYLKNNFSSGVCGSVPCCLGNR